MKRSISLLLSFVLALTACLSMAVASVAAAPSYSMPGKIRDQQGGSTRSTELSYDAKSKTLTAVSEDENTDALFDYLLNQSTDSVSNRFLDQNNVAAKTAGSPYRDLFSSDAIRSGKIKTLVIKRMDPGRTKIAQYSFNAKNNRLLSSKAEFDNNAFGRTRTETRYEYNENGTISKITKHDKTDNTETRTELKFGYDIGGRLDRYEVEFRDERNSKNSYDSKVSFQDFQNGCPKQSTTERNGKKTTQSYPEWRFDGQKRVTENGSRRYNYDGSGRLNRTNVEHSSRNVEYSNFFQI